MAQSALTQPERSQVAALAPGGDLERLVKPSDKRVYV